MEWSYFLFSGAKKNGIIDEADAEKVLSHNWSINRQGYLAYCIWPKNEMIRLHHFLIGKNPDGYVDHINGNPLDNRRCNLRFVTPTQNSMNSRKTYSKRNSKYKGVGWSKTNKKWRAYITIQKKLTFLGHYNSEEEAAIAYNDAAAKHFGEFARPNILTNPAKDE